MPAHDHCCVPNCSNRRDKCPEVSFHGIPANEDLRKRWLVAIRRDVGPHFRISSSTVVCGAHFTAADFSTGSRQGSGAVKSKTRRLKREAVPSVFAWNATAKTRPAPRERSLSTLSAEVRVATCATEVDTLRAELAQTWKDLERAKEEAMFLRTQVLRFENLVEADKVHHASGKKGEQAVHVWCSDLHNSSTVVVILH